MFKGKSINYSTEVTTTKGEAIAFWVAGLTTIFGGFICFPFADELPWLPYVVIGGGIVAVFTIAIFITFRPKHKEERLKNAKINGELASERKLRLEQEAEEKKNLLN